MMSINAILNQLDHLSIVVYLLLIVNGRFSKMTLISVSPVLILPKTAHMAGGGEEGDEHC